LFCPLPNSPGNAALIDSPIPVAKKLATVDEDTIEVTPDQVYNKASSGNLLKRPIREVVTGFLSWYRRFWACESVKPWRSVVGHRSEVRKASGGFESCGLCQRGRAAFSVAEDKEQPAQRSHCRQSLSMS
jgi:hypothetical protein